MKFPAFEPIDLKEGLDSIEAVQLALTKIVPDKNQPRKMFDENALEELASSIKQHGVIQPIIVRQFENGKFQIVAGERRWRASKLAGLEKIPVIIKEYDQSNKLAVSLIENIQRESLNPLEEAEAIQSLLVECNMTHNQVAENIGRSRTSVTNLLRLLALTPQVKVMINANLLEMGHARALLGLNGNQQIETAELIVKQSLSVRETEKLINKINEAKDKPTVIRKLEFEKKACEWKSDLSKRFSSKVKVHVNSEGKGRFVIPFDSVEEAEWIMNRCMVKKIQEVE